MKLTQKIHAGALQFVLFIGAVVALLLMAFILLSFTHSHFDNKTDTYVAVVKSADFGMKAALKIPMALNVETAVRSETDIPVAISVKRDFWGVFERRTVTTSHGNTEYEKTALIGGKDKQELPALYVNDHQRPVILAGNAMITGTAFLPEQGLKMGNIHGNSYHRSSLLYGQQKKSDSLLPKLSPELDAQIAKLTHSNYVPEGRVWRSIQQDGLQNSFTEPTAIIRDRLVRLSDVDLAGNIIVSASYKIIVEADAHLQDVVLIAPEIEIQNWVKGSFQAIASESISVGKKCELYYPSALIVKKKPVSTHAGNTSATPTFNVKPAIYLDSYAKVRGMVVTLDDSKQPQYAPQIKMDMESKVIGEVYCSKNLELKGRVNGAVATDGFIALEDGSVYQNHLYNGTINSTNLDTSYAGLLLASRENNKKVMKWLY